MSNQGFKPFKYLSSSINAALSKKAKREASILGNTGRSMSLFDHIKDLRKHIIRSLLWLVLFSGISCLFMNPIILFLKRPYNFFLELSKQKGIPQNLTSINIFEVMTVNFKICTLVGFIISLPFILIEIWKFISPALYKAEKRIALIILVSSVILFYIGLCFGFFLMIPYFFRGALNWASNYAVVMISYESYFNSLVTMMLIFAAIFEVPVVLSLLGLANIISSKALIRNRKIAFISCFIIGAILAPPEVISLCLVALPIYFMVEISIYIIRRIEKKRELAPNTTPIS